MNDFRPLNRARPGAVRRLAVILALGIALPLAVTPRESLAQTNELVIPIAAGGAMDAALRAVGGELARSWGEPVVPVNKPGAGMALGVRYLLGLNTDSKSILGGGLPMGAFGGGVAAAAPKDFPGLVSDDNLLPAAWHVAFTASDLLVVSVTLPFAICAAVGM